MNSNSIMKRLLAAVLCAALLIAGNASVAFARSDVNTNPEPAKAAQSTAADAAQSPAAKDETVYVLTAADGTVQNVIVSDWLKNNDGSELLRDVSELTDVENVGGDEGFTQDGTGLVWDAQGSDIYYRGTTDKKPPVALTVRYYLDGAEISPAALAGKSGHVMIRFDYENREHQSVTLDGKQEELYVPFAVLTGLALDNEVFSNVEVSNGKLVNDGEKTFVVGLAFPGLQEDLNLSADKLELPSYVEISADAERFALGMSVTVVTNEPFNSLDPDTLMQNGNVDGLQGSIDAMEDGMAQLLNGSSALYDGLCTLLDKSGELASGVNTLTDGARTLKNGADALNSGAGSLASGAATLDAGAGSLASGAAALANGAGTLKDGAGSLASGAAKLSDGAAELAAGLTTLDANSAALTGGALQVFQTLLATAQTQLTDAGLQCPALTVSNYADVLGGLIDSLDEEKVYAQALATVTEAVEAKRDYITQQVTAAVQAEVESRVTSAVRAQVEAQVTSAVREQIRPQVEEAVRAQVRARIEAAVQQSVTAQVIRSVTGMDAQEYQAAVAAGQVAESTQAAVQAAINAQMASEAVQQTIEAQLEAKMAESEVQQLVEAQLDTAMNGAEAQAAVAANTDAQLQSADVQATIAALTAEQMDSDDIRAVIAQNTEAQVQQAIADAMASDEVQSKLAAASEGAQKIIALKTSLDSYNAFYLGLIAYTNGVASAAAGASELASGAVALKTGAKELADGTASLKSGADELAAGAATLKSGTTQLTGGAATLASGAEKLAGGEAALYDGTLSLNNAMPELIDGVSQLADGAMELSDGLREFNEKGIAKLIDAVNDNLPALLARLRAICAVSNAYQSFTGLSDEMPGQVKFIYRTEGIEAE